MKVVIEPYNSQWAVNFQETKKRLQFILQHVPIISIEHVGSTAVPGLWAKPIIDIDIVIIKSSLEAAEDALTQAGYTSLGEIDVPGRYMFREPAMRELAAADGRDEDTEIRRNTYVCIEGCASLRNHLDVRRVLLSDQNLREEYSDLKVSLRETEFNHIHEYVARKTGVPCKILRAAGWSEEELKQIMDINS